MLPIDRVSDASGEHFSCRGAFRQVVLRASLDGAKGKRFVFPAGQDNDGNIRRQGDDSCQAVQIYDVGQTEIEQDQIVCRGGQLVDCGSDRRDVIVSKRGGRNAHQRRADETCVRRIVFDE
jgi:hypothetical protein